MSTATDIIMELLEYDSEREWFEFKANWFRADELGEYISALSNSAAIAGRKNAYFVWGVDDKNHAIVGTNFNCNQDINHEPLKHYLARRLSPSINFLFDEADIDGKLVVLLTIPAAKTVPTSYDGERYIRIGSSKESVRKYPEKESYLFEVLRHGLPSIENTRSTYQDLTFEQLLIYYGAKGLKLNPDTFKRNLSLYTEDGEYNILAQLLSDNSHIPIRVAIFSGKTKADNMYSVREFGNQCLLYSLDEVLRYGDVLNIIQADERNRVVERKEVPLFENDAFREAVINAFVHNKWVTGNEPMISVFSDRIEILSRGSLAPEQTMEGFFAGESVPVNHKLSEIMLQLHISEKTGRGVPKITQRYGKEAFEFRENSIVVTIPFNWINVMAREERHESKAEAESRIMQKSGFEADPGAMQKTGAEADPGAMQKTGAEADPGMMHKSGYETVQAAECENVLAMGSETALAAGKEVAQDDVLNKTQKRILAELQKNPDMTKASLADTLNLGKTTIDNGISVLKKYGFIKRVGSNKLGYWKLCRNGKMEGNHHDYS